MRLRTLRGRRLIRDQEVVWEFTYAVGATHFLLQQRQLGYVKVLVEIGDLIEILLLDLSRQNSKAFPCIISYFKPNQTHSPYIWRRTWHKAAGRASWKATGSRWCCGCQCRTWLTLALAALSRIGRETLRCIHIQKWSGPGFRRNVRSQRQELETTECQGVKLPGS